MTYSLREITQHGETFFAVIGDEQEVVTRLHDCANRREARIAFHNYIAALS